MADADHRLGDDPARSRSPEGVDPARAGDHERESRSVSAAEYAAAALCAMRLRKHAWLPGALGRRGELTGFSPPTPSPVSDGRGGSPLGRACSLLPAPRGPGEERGWGRGVFVENSAGNRA